MIIIGAANWGGPFAIRRAQLSKKCTIFQCYVAGGWPRLNSGVTFPLWFRFLQRVGRSSLFRPSHRRNPCSSERDDAETSLTAGAGRALYDDFNVTAEQGQELHESLCGEARKLPAEQARDFWLVNFQYPRSVCLR